MTKELDQRLRPVPVGADVFHGIAASKPRRIYGGEIAAQAISAANQTVGPDRAPHSLQCTYLRAGDPTIPVEYRVARVRDGRGFSTRQVDAMQGGKVIQASTVSYHVGSEGFDHQLTMPSVPGPEELTGIANHVDAAGKAWGDWAADLSGFDLRPVPPDLEHPYGRRQFWIRFDEPQESEAFGRVLTTYASDLTMIASIRLPHEPDGRKSWLITSLTHNVYFHRPHSSSDWVLWDHHSPVAAGQRGLAMAHAYTPDGQLVVSAVQEGLATPWQD